MVSFIDKFPEQGRIVCEQCRINQKRSRVYSRVFSDKTEYESYHDEEGIRVQVPSLDITTWLYRCSNGHAWSESSIRRTDRDVVGD